MTGIVYKLLFIYKWFNSANLDQNTHINKPKSTCGKQIEPKVSKLYQIKQLSPEVKKQDI